jgi:hypothetical protein
MSVVREPRFNLGKHIYNALISVYSALYKTTSPLTMDWRTKEVSEMMGNDHELIRLFCIIKTEIYWFCKQLITESIILGMWANNEHPQMRIKIAWTARTLF